MKEMNDILPVENIILTKKTTAVCPINTYVSYAIYKSEIPIEDKEAQLEMVEEPSKRIFETYSGSYEKEAKETQLPIVGKNKACFATLPCLVQFGKRNGYNRLVFWLKSKDKIRSISTHRMKKYLQLSKQAGTLPKYADINILSKTRALTLTLDHDIRGIFIYLTIFRTIEHDPIAIHTVVSLVDRYKLDYFTALSCAHSFFQNSNHSFFPNNVRQYPIEYKFSKKREVDVGMGKALQHFIEKDFVTPKKEGSRFSAFGVDTVLSTIQREEKLHEKVLLGDLVAQSKRGGKNANT